MEPENTSTPKKFTVTGRSGIRDYKENEVLSPVPNANEPLTYPQIEPVGAQHRKSVTNDVHDVRDSHNEDDGGDRLDNANGSNQQEVKPVDDEDVDDSRYEEEPETLADAIPQNITNTNLFIVILALIGLGMSCAVLPYSSSNNLTDDSHARMNKIQNKFPSQDDDSWIYINSSIFEAKTFDKPSVMIFLYRHDAEATVKNLLADTAEYASCILNGDCLVEPISLTGAGFNQPELLEDYGVALSKYGPQLESRRIMIVENFDEISAFVAQAFHSFCDEFTPVVGPSLFLFTIRVDEFVGKELTQAEKLLREKWAELDGDKLEPLLTRISNIVLKVTPEV